MRLRKRLRELSEGKKGVEVEGKRTESRKKSRMMKKGDQEEMGSLTEDLKRASINEGSFSANDIINDLNDGINDSGHAVATSGRFVIGLF